MNYKPEKSSFSPNYSGTSKNLWAQLILVLPPVFYSEIVFKRHKMKEVSHLYGNKIIKYGSEVSESFALYLKGIRVL